MADYDDVQTSRAIHKFWASWLLLLGGIVSLLSFVFLPWIDGLTLQRFFTTGSEDVVSPITKVILVLALYGSILLAAVLALGSFIGLLQRRPFVPLRTLVFLTIVGICLITLLILDSLIRQNWHTIGSGAVGMFVGATLILISSFALRRKLY